MSTIKPKTSPPPTSHVLLSYPADHVLLVTINREKQMNSIPYAGHQELGYVFDWFDKEDNLRCAIITGAGKKSFCAGQDLIELGRIRSGKSDVNPGLMRHPTSGFAGELAKSRSLLLSTVSRWEEGLRSSLAGELLFCPK